MITNAGTLRESVSLRLLRSRVRVQDQGMSELHSVQKVSQPSRCLCEKKL